MGTGPLFPRTATRGRATLPPLGNSAPLSLSDGGAVLRQTFGVRGSWTYCWSAPGPAKHRAECMASGLPSGKTTVVVHPLSISARVARLLNDSAEPVNVRPRRRQSLRRVVLLRAGLGRS